MGPRDVGADVGFADVQAHYAELLDRPSIAVVGELMEQVFGEWRREGSPNRGGPVLWLRNLQPGDGSGVLDVDGRPKSPWWHQRPALSTRAAWLTDEGLDGGRPSDSSFCLEPRRQRRITGVEGRALLTSPQLRHPVDVASARPSQAT